MAPKKTPTSRRRGSSEKTTPDVPLSETWIDQESAECQFGDVRLGKRFQKLLEQISGGVGNSIPVACQDWANTKAAYRFFSNEGVSEEEILRGHFQSTQQRAEVAEGPILVLHDTSEFVYKREDETILGLISRPARGRDPEGRLRHHTVRGILMHSSLAVSVEGLPLGLAAIKFWTRDHFKGCNALKRKINPTRIPIEEKESFRWIENLRQSTELLKQPERCVHIGDRESDIYELFSAATKIGTRFLVRTCVDRLAGDGQHTVRDEMERARVNGKHRIEVRNNKGEPAEAVLEVRYRRIQIQPPIGKCKDYSPLTLTVIEAREEETPDGREKIEWKLLTNLSVTSFAEAIEKLNWYAMRWKIETFHKILKSGCKAEESKLRSSQRLANLISVFCIVSWRIFWMTMINRTDPNASPDIALTELESRLLDELVKDSKRDSPRPTLSLYLTKIARLGGYLARASDPPPGNMVMWRGMSRLTDIQLGFLLGAKLVGN